MKSPCPFATFTTQGVRNYLTLNVTWIELYKGIDTTDGRRMHLRYKLT